MSERTYTVAVDIGGTCTDCVVMDDRGAVTLAKAFSTPADFSDGIVDALGVAGRELEVDVKSLLRRTRLFLHSTTIAENAIVNGDFAPAGLLVTRGFDYTLFSTRGGYGRWSGLTEEEKRNPIYSDKPPPVIPIERIQGIRERTIRDGSVLAEVDGGEVQQAVERLRAAGAESFGVCLLWAYVNDSNERAAGTLVSEAARDAFVTLSSELAPTIGEYERMSTVALNAGLGPVVGGYLSNLEQKLAALEFAGALLVMQAYGGLIPIPKAMRSPVGLIESGPVAGLLGCAHLGRMLGVDDILAADMGGTTFKVGTVRHGRIEYQREPQVVRYHYSTPKMDVVSLGLAGGSIVSVDQASGLPRVGPRSAGSYPGPVCYVNGGLEPTVTDVDAILGFLEQDHFLGGRARLDVDAAREAFESKVAAPLGFGLDAAAASIYRLANSMIYDLLHKTTVQRGLDPRRFALFSVGGTAGMHLPAVGEALGVQRVVIPHTASVQSAFGLATTDVVHEELLTRPVRMPVAPEVVDESLRGITRAVTAQLHDDGFDDEAITVDWAVDMRYRRQVHIITVPLEVEPRPERRGRVDSAALDRLVHTFESLYVERYGPESAYREAGIELVAFRARGSGAVRRPEIATRPPVGLDASRALVEHRRAYVLGLDDFADVPGYLFELLEPGNRIPGPAIVWTPITTVVVGLRQFAAVDSYMNLSIERSEGPS